MKIGYMGIPFSNSEEAALLFVRNNRWNTADILPLMTAFNVVDRLKGEFIDYGVVASKNAVAGPVKETVNALSDNDNIDVYQTMDIPIHHCLFVLSENCDVKAVASHPQALLQCDKTLKRLYPNVKRIEAEDTAYAAEMLSDGELPEGTAVICRKDAGEQYGLVLLRENIEDDPMNMTTFSLIRLKSRSFPNVD